MQLITIDGSRGEGGGQMVRSSLALSALTGKPFDMINIRANRSSPGLKRQHLTCLEAAAAICQAQLSGNRLGAREIEFSPGAIQPGEYRFDIASAGSCSLVAQTIWLPLAMAQAASNIIIIGGTYNTMAPPFDFLEKAYVPAVRRMGFQLTAIQEAPGFYPRGGGCLALDIQPSSMFQSLSILERGRLVERKIVSVLGRLPQPIADTELGTACRKLGWSKKETETVTFDQCHSPGNVLFAVLNYENVTEVVTEFGKQGLPADKVAGRLVRSVKGYLESNAPVGSHLADQLLLPMGVLAHRASNAQPLTSQFVTCELTEHSLTHIEILQMFLDIDVNVDTLDLDGKNLNRVTVSPKAFD